MGTLCVKSGEKQYQVHTAIACCSRLVTYLGKSSWATHVLSEKQEALGTKQHKLLQDVETRWNTMYDMICHVMEQQAPMRATLVQQKRMDLLPKNDEFQLLEELMVVLKSLKNVTEQMCPENYVTISVILQILHLLENVLNTDPLA